MLGKLGFVWGFRGAGPGAGAWLVKGGWKGVWDVRKGVEWIRG